MRKIYFVFGAVVSAALASGMVACSSDDTSTDTNPGTDSGTPDTSTPVADSGKPDTGTPDSGPVDCARCGEILQKGLSGAGKSPCTGTTEILQALVDCTCKTDPLTMTATDGGLCDKDSGTGECADLCASPLSTVPSSACQGCAATQCTAQTAACVEDGADGGTGTPDAGDAGDGG